MVFSIDGPGLLVLLPLVVAIADEDLSVSFESDLAAVVNLDVGKKSENLVMVDGSRVDGSESVGVSGTGAGMGFPDMSHIGSSSSLSSPNEVLKLGKRCVATA